MARIGVMRASYRNVVWTFDSSRKYTHWGRRKLKRDKKMTVLIYVNTSKQVGYADHLWCSQTPIGFAGIGFVSYRRMSPLGTFETCRRTLKMSAINRGKPEAQTLKCECVDYLRDRTMADLSLKHALSDPAPADRGSLTETGHALGKQVTSGDSDLRSNTCG
jgi:hypothetical protein